MSFVRTDETHSLWMDEGPRTYAPLPGDLDADVVVVGGGITGATTALLLKRKGLRVVLVDAAALGNGETARTTAHLTQVLDVRYAWLSSHMNKEAATVAARAHGEAIDAIERIAAELAVDCDFVRVPGFLYTERAEGVAELEAERAAMAAIGLPATLVSETPLPFPVKRALRVENQAQFHPEKYMRALLAAVHGDGSAVYERTRVLALHEGEPCRVETDRGALSCGAVVVAAHVPVGNRVLLHTKIAPYRSYVVTVDANAPDPLGLFWDTASPYHYWRTHRVGDDVLFIVGGDDHKVGQRSDTEEAFASLERYVHERLPGARIRHRWSGQIIEPADGLPYIGRNSLSKRIFVATGFAGNGMTGGTLAALILAEDVVGREHPWGHVFTATRVRPRAAGLTIIKENADYAKHLVADRFGAPPMDAVAALAPGEGCVVDGAGGRLAVYRSPVGHLSACSAVCTHLGCIVGWNTAEKTWDCPCHGSRYDPYGEVINGPATQPLARRNLLTEDQEEESYAPADALGPTMA